MRLSSVIHTTGLLFAFALLQSCIEVQQTADKDNNISHINVNHHAIHTEVFGAKNLPVLIVIHGGPGADSRYLLALSALSDRYRVVFYDQLGSGLSQRVPSTHITLASFIADLDGVISHFSPHASVSILGHSWGAMLATAYAGQHPEKVNRLVLAEPGFLDADSLSELDFNKSPSWHLIAKVSSSWINKWRVNSNGDSYAREDWFLQQILPATQDPSSLCNGRLPELAAWRFGSPAFAATVGRMMDDPAWAKTLNFTQGLENYHGKVLFIRGECNREQDESSQRKMMKKFGSQNQAMLVSVKDAGHFMFNDQPEASIAVVREFLGSAM